MPSKVQREREKIRKAQEPPELLPQQPTYQMDPEEEEMENVFAAFPQTELCIELYRVNVQGGRPAFLEQLAPVTFSQAYVAETYGGGRFLAKGKYKDGSPLKMAFDIEGDPIQLKRKNPVAQPGITPQQVFLPAPVVGEGSEGGKDFQTSLVAVMQTIVQQMQGSEMAMLEKMKIYKDLFGSPTQKEAPLDQMINMFTKGIELSSMNVGGGGGDGSFPWMMVIKELKEPLMKIVETVQLAVGKPKQSAVVNQPAPVLPQSPVPGQSLHNVGVALDVETRGEPDMVMLFVKQVLPALINGAARNADPANYVDFLLDQIPTGGYDAFRTWLMQPDCLDKLVVVEPGIRFQQEWWVSLRGGLLEALNEELGHAVRTLHPESDSNPSAASPPDSPLIP